MSDDRPALEIDQFEICPEIVEAAVHIYRDWEGERSHMPDYHEAYDCRVERLVKAILSLRVKKLSPKIIR